METFEISSEQIEKKDRASMDAENIYFPLANSVRRELETLHPLSNQCCIYRVPRQLRQLDEKMYTPQLVSIGPLHHGRDELKPMEEHKKRYLQDFLKRTEVSIEYLILFIKEREATLRNCYAEAIELGSDDFVKMILFDATFIIELLLRYSFAEFRSSIDRIFTKPSMIKYIRYDIWLLENQLPLYILEDLFKLTNIAMSFNHDEIPSLIKLIYKFSQKLWDLDVPEGLLEKNPSTVVEHFVDFVRICHQPLKPCPRNKLKILSTPSVIELQQAGVKFKLGSSKNVLDIRFNNGILKIPKLNIGPGSELLFRNLRAFEECHDCDNYINDYVTIMTYLVNAPKDVELLVQNGILDNWMANSEDVSTLFQKLAREAFTNPEDFYFADLVEDLNAYCRSSWHKWKATLKHDYFSTPWAVISVFAAALFLVLSFIQAVCAIISV